MLPTIKQLELALSVLEYTDEVKAALHLVMPISEIMGIAVVKTSKGWYWRGALLEVGENVPTSVLKFVKNNANPEDSFLDLDAPQESWLKISKSGSRLVAFGAEFLFGAPTLLGEPSLRAEDFQDALRYWKEHGSNPLTLTSSRGTTLLIDQDENCWFLRNAQKVETAQLASSESIDLEELGADIAKDLNAKLVGFLQIGSNSAGLEVEYHFSVDRHSVIVPVIIARSSFIIGVQSGDLLDVLDWEEIPGWVWRGWDRWSNSKVAENLRSGILARFP